jgi:single-strand DNA-binding protein
MINKVQLIGRLGSDPETKEFSGGKSVVNFSVATSESWKDKEGNKQEKTEWHNVQAFGKLGEICQRYLQKGASVFIEGKIIYSKSEKDGKTTYFTKIVARDMKMLGSKGDNQNSNQSQGVTTTNTAEEAEDDLPF